MFPAPGDLGGWCGWCRHNLPAKTLPAPRSLRPQVSPELGEETIDAVPDRFATWISSYGSIYVLAILGCEHSHFSKSAFFLSKNLLTKIPSKLSFFRFPCTRFPFPVCNT